MLKYHTLRAHFQELAESLNTHLASRDDPSGSD
jgi:hypothetical protein